MNDESRIPSSSCFTGDPYLTFALEAARVDAHNLVKAVHVELAHETRHIRVFVVIRQQALGEFALVVNYEAVS